MGEHPKDRPAEPADPLKMMAGGVAGDPGLMLDCMVEEYARIGFGEAQILELFESQEFLATHGLRNLFGSDGTRDRVREVLSRCGVMRVTTTVARPESQSLCQGTHPDA
ncbi:MAG: hypothetical protein CMJ84_15005 [Planctomycetes bacterium]|jgi:hypothetical protein|nr:hypothetical protein [Planctomycetota bacterium]